MSHVTQFCTVRPANLFKINTSTQPLSKCYISGRYCAHLYAVVTDAAVGAARRAVELARGAPLHPDGDAADLHVLVQRQPEVVIAVLVRRRCRPGAGVSGVCGGSLSFRKWK